jgi:hypothetical protein
MNRWIIRSNSLPPSPSQTIDRKSFLKLPIEERDRILEQQAEAALPYYQENQAEWQEWVNLNGIDRSTIAHFQQSMA